MGFLSWLLPSWLVDYALSLVMLVLCLAVTVKLVKGGNLHRLLFYALFALGLQRCQSLPLEALGISGRSLVGSAGYFTESDHRGQYHEIFSGSPPNYGCFTTNDSTMVVGHSGFGLVVLCKYGAFSGGRGCPRINNTVVHRRVPDMQFGAEQWWIPNGEDKKASSWSRAWRPWFQLNNMTALLGQMSANPSYCLFPYGQAGASVDCVVDSYTWSNGGQTCNGFMRLYSLYPSDGDYQGMLSQEVKLLEGRNGTLNMIHAGHGARHIRALSGGLRSTRGADLGLPELITRHPGCGRGQVHESTPVCQLANKVKQLIDLTHKGFSSTSQGINAALDQVAAALNETYDLRNQLDIVIGKIWSQNCTGPHGHMLRYVSRVWQGQEYYVRVECKHDRGRLGRANWTFSKDVDEAFSKLHDTITELRFRNSLWHPVFGLLCGVFVVLLVLWGFSLMLGRPSVYHLMVDGAEVCPWPCRLNSSGCCSCGANTGEFPVVLARCKSCTV